MKKKKYLSLLKHFQHVVVWCKNREQMALNEKKKNIYPYLNIFSMSWCGARIGSKWLYRIRTAGMLQFVAANCSVLQYVAAHCSVLQFVTVWLVSSGLLVCLSVLQCVAVCCSAWE